MSVDDDTNTKRYYSSWEWVYDRILGKRNNQVFKRRFGLSGGHYNYWYRQMKILADDIERDFLQEGKYTGKDWQRGEPIEEDWLADATPDQRKEILTEVTSLISDLRRCARRAKELEWYLSGDTGADTYLERIVNCR